MELLGAPHSDAGMEVERRLSGSPGILPVVRSIQGAFGTSFQYSVKKRKGEKNGKAKESGKTRRGLR